MSGESDCAEDRKRSRGRVEAKMTYFRYSLVLFLVFLASMSSIHLIRSEVEVVTENAIAQNLVADLNSFPSVLEGAGCFGVRTRIPGVDGAFAAIAVDDVGGVYVAYQGVAVLYGEYYYHVYFSYSHDYGSSWSESFRVNDNDNASVVCDTPSIAVDPLTRHVFVAWKDNRTGVAKVYVDKSTDRGVSFGTDALVYDWPYDTMYMGYPRTVNIEVGQEGKVYVAWIMYEGANPYDCDIFFAKSTDGGQAFSTPTNVNPAEDEARHYHPWIAVSTNGTIYVAYAKRNSTSVGVYLSRSQSDGVSFGPPVRIDDEDTGTRYRGGVQIIIAPNGGVHATWTDGRAGDGTQYMDIYYADSSDGGASFSPNIRVNDDTIMTPPDTHPHFTRGVQGSPSIVADSTSRVHLVWEDFRNFVNENTYCRDVYYASSEKGTVFTKNLRANPFNASATFVDCADPVVAIDSQDNLFMAYSDAPTDDSTYHAIYFMMTPKSAWNWTSFLDWSHYHNYTEITTILSGLNDTYPDIVDAFSIGQSWSDRDIYCLRLTNESYEQAKQEVLFVGYHHAQEQISAELPLYYVVDAATDYGSDENATILLNTREIYVVVALNVDGLDLFESNDRQRKNARPIDEDDDGSLDEDPPEDLNGNGLIDILVNYTDPYNPELLEYEGIDNDTDGVNGEDWIGGVDLNRNYPIGWENAGSDPSSPVYRGPAAFSEPETQALRDLVLEHNFTHAISFHSGLEFILYPWGCTADSTPDDAKFVEIAQDLSGITGGTQYDSPTVMYGIWDDWMYGEAGVLALTCEIFRNGTWMDAVIETGPYPNTSWVGGERWLYNPFPSGIETVIQRWLPVFTYIVELARPPDLAVSTIITPKNIIGQGTTMNVTVVVANQGSMIEEFNVTLYFSDDVFESLLFSVKSGESIACNFSWDTSSFSKGNYTISAYVWPVPGETDTTDNTLYYDLEVCVTIPGDVDGDFDVDLYDAVKLLVHYGAEEGSPEYDPVCDIDGDGDIDLYDAVTLLTHYGQEYP
jgi:hypothetical protein